MFVDGEVPLDVGFDAARGGLAGLIRGGALLTASRDAYGRVAVILSLAAPSGATRMPGWAGDHAAG